MYNIFVDSSYVQRYQQADRLLLRPVIVKTRRKMYIRSAILNTIGIRARETVYTLAMSVSLTRKNRGYL